MIDLNVTGGMFAHEVTNHLAEAIRELQMLVGDLRLRVEQLERDLDEMKTRESVGWFDRRDAVPIAPRADAEEQRSPADHASALAESKDAARLDWISRQGSEFESSIIMDAPGADEYFVFGGGGVYGQGVTFRDALDAAILAASKEKP